MPVSSTQAAREDAGLALVKVILAYAAIRVQPQPRGRLATVRRLNCIRRLLQWDAASPYAQAAITEAIMALRRRAPDAAVRLRRLSDLDIEQQLREALLTISERPLMAIVS